MSFEKAIKSVYKKEVFWTFLSAESIAQSGPFDGGCLICAKAMIRASGGGSLVRIVSEANGGQTEHYGALIDGEIYDFDGHHSSPKAWINRFEELEQTGRELSFASGHDPGSDIPDDPFSEKKIASLIIEELRNPGRSLPKVVKKSTGMGM